MIEIPVFILTFVFVLMVGSFPCYMIRLSPIQAQKGLTLAQRRWNIQTRIWNATLGMGEHKKGSQFHKMHNDNKIKAMGELLEIEREYDGS